MTTYYIRQSGNDSAPGTSAATAWHSLTKVLTGTTVTGGDTVYIGAGIYRETQITTSLTVSGVVNIVGDISGQYTGDAGEVCFSNFRNGDDGPSTLLPIVSLNAKSNFAFSNITFYGATNSSTSGLVINSTAGSLNIGFTRCAFLQVQCGPLYGACVANYAASAGVPLNWTIDSCLFYSNTSSPLVTIQTAKSNTATDYDANVLLKNNMFFSLSGGGISLPTPSTSSTGKPGGIRVYHNTFFVGTSTAFLLSGSAVWSTTYPVALYHNLFIGGNTSIGMSAAATGQVTEDFNHIMTTTPRTNVATGVHSTTTNTASRGTPIEIGQSFLYGLTPRMFGSPANQSYLLNYGEATTGALAVDMLGRNRAALDGTLLYADTYATSQGAGGSTLYLPAYFSSSGPRLGANAIGGCVTIVSGTGAGYTYGITQGDTTGTQLSLANGTVTALDTSSVFAIYSAPFVTQGICSAAGTTTSLVDSTGLWPNNKFAGWSLDIIGGTGNGGHYTISANTSTTLTTSTMSVAPDATSIYAIYHGLPAQGLLGGGATAGALERVENGVPDTNYPDGGTGACIVITGRGEHEFLIPVDSTATAITIKVRWDGNHGDTTKPQAVLVANPTIGVATQTVVATTTGGTGITPNGYENLSFAAFTPTGAGVVAIRLQNRASTVFGRAWFDTFTVS